MQIQGQEHKALSERKVWSVKATPPLPDRQYSKDIQKEETSSPLLLSTFPSEAFSHYRLTRGLQVVLLMPSEPLGDNWTTSKSLERMSKLKKSKGNLFLTQTIT